jgi:hypothetical protein
MEEGRRFASDIFPEEEAMISISHWGMFRDMGHQEPLPEDLDVYHVGTVLFTRDSMERWEW